MLSRTSSSKGSPGKLRTDVSGLLCSDVGAQTPVKQLVLSQLEQALAKLKIQHEMDEPPFTTGPRRAVALANIGERKGETEGERRSRMHRIVVAFSKEKLLTSSGKKLWSGYSKSKPERDVASHCSWVKRTAASMNPAYLETIDCDYGSGSVCGKGTA